MQEYFKQQLNKIEKMDIIDIDYEDSKFNQILAVDILSSYIKAIKILDDENIVNLRNYNLKDYINKDEDDDDNEDNETEFFDVKIKRAFSELIENEADNKKLIKIIDNLGKSFGINYNFSSIIQNAAIISAYNGSFIRAFEFNKISAEYCNNQKSHDFIKNILNINKFIYKYNLCIDMLKQEMYDEIITILEEQKKMDFRTIQSEIILCILYLSKKDYKKSEVILNNIYNIDKSNLLYFEITNQLQELKRKAKKKNYAAVSAILVACITLNTYQAYIILNKRTSQAIKYVVKTKVIENKKPSKNVQSMDKNIQIINNLSNYILGNNYYAFEVEKEKINAKELTGTNLNTFNKLNQKYIAVAEKYFYNSGFELFKAKNYKKSYEYFIIANKYKKGDFLDQHILFMVAKSAYLSNEPNCIDYYKQYIGKYSAGCYIEEALYDITMLSLKANNIKESKDYANRLLTKYPKSKFSNEKIKSVLKK